MAIGIEEFGRQEVGATPGTSLPPGWVLPIDHLSATQLNMLAVCPRQYQQRYIRGRKEPPGQALVMGSVFHKTHEHNFQQKIETHEDLPIDELLDYCNDEAWNTTIDSYGGENEIMWDDTGGDVRLVETEMVTTYHREVSPLVQPLLAETPFSVDIADVPVPVVGVVDIVTADRIIDLKTSKLKRKVMKPDWRIQGRVYQLYLPRDVSFHVTTKSGTVTCLTPSEHDGLRHTYTSIGWIETERFVLQLAWLANDLYQKYGPDEDWPTLGFAHDWRCNWCGYKGDCPVWRT